MAKKVKCPAFSNTLIDICEPLDLYGLSGEGLLAKERLVPIDLIELTIAATASQPRSDRLRFFFNKTFENPEKALFTAKRRHNFDHDASHIVEIIRQSPNFDPTSHGYALSKVAPTKFKEVRTLLVPNHFENQINVAVLDGNAFKSCLMKLEISEAGQGYQPPSFLKMGWEVACAALHLIGIYNIESYGYHFTLDGETLGAGLSETKLSGSSCDLAVAALVFFNFVGRKLPEGTAAVGTLNKIRQVQRTEDLREKLKVLDCQRLLVAEDVYIKALDFFDEQGKTAPEIIPLNTFDDIFRYQSLFEDLPSPTEKKTSLTYTEINLSGFNLQNSPSICGLYLPFVTLYSDLTNGYRVSQLHTDYTDTEIDWIPELRGIEELTVEKYKARKKNETGVEPKLFNGDVLNIDAVDQKTVLTDGVEYMHIDHKCSKGKYYQYITQLEIFSNPKQEPLREAYRFKYGRFGTNLSATKLAKAASAAVFVTFGSKGKSSPELVMLTRRAQGQASHGDTLSASMCCAIHPGDTIENMMNNPKDYGFDNADEITELLKGYEIPFKQPQFFVSILRELKRERNLGLKLNPNFTLDQIRFRALVLKLRDYPEITWIADIRFNRDEPQVASFLRDAGVRGDRVESDETKSVIIQPINDRIDASLLKIIDDDWHPVVLCGYLFLLASIFGWDEVTQRVEGIRKRKLWLGYGNENCVTI